MEYIDYRSSTFVQVKNHMVITFGLFACPKYHFKMIHRPVFAARDQAKWTNMCTRHRKG